MNLRKPQIKSESFPSWLELYTDESKHLVSLSQIDNHKAIYIINLSLKLIAQLQFFRSDNLFYGCWILLVNRTYLTGLQNDNNSFMIKTPIKDNFDNDVHKFIMNDISNPEYNQIAFISSGSLMKTMKYLKRRYNI